MELNFDYLDSLCEVKLMNNDSLAMGRISEIDEDSMIVDNRRCIEGEVFEDTPVKVNILNSRLGSLFLTGKLHLFSNAFCKIIDIELLADIEHRQFFRLNVKENGHVYNRITRSFDQEVQLIDISLGGFYMISPIEITAQQVNLRFVWQQHLFQVEGRIIRTKEEESGIGYACAFMNMIDDEQDILCRLLFEKQKKM